jgi:hypothetical protein
MSRPNAALIAEIYPDVEVRGDLGEQETLLSIDKARRLLGYRPACGWRETATSVVRHAAGRALVLHPTHRRSMRPPASLVRNALTAEAEHP